MTAVWFVVGIVATCVGIWSLLRAERTLGGLARAATAFGAVGVAGALMEGSPIKALGQGVCLGAAGLAAAWILGRPSQGGVGNGRPARNGSESGSTLALGGNVWFGVLAAGVVGFFMWVSDAATMPARIAFTVLLLFLVAGLILRANQRYRSS
jgi:hypothetical protein